MTKPSSASNTIESQRKLLSGKHILHVMQYLSLGGAGRAMIATAKYSRQTSQTKHSVASLLPPDPQAVQFAQKEGMSFVPSKGPADVLRAMEQADIVALQWWNSPEMYELTHAELPETRLLAWCHVGGHRAPQVIIPRFVEFCDFVVACSPHTYLCPAIQDLPDEQRLAKTSMAYGAADFARLAGIQPVKHDGFHVGYIGTVHFQKMHPDYVAMSASADVPGIQFIVCGPDETGGTLQQQIIDHSAAQKFDLRGYVEDIKSVIATFDVYGYPLCEDNYSGSEVNLQEVMYAGVPPVVFPYGGVRHLVVDNFTGLVVHSAREYKQALEHLHHFPDDRKRLGENAALYARQIFGAENAARKLDQAYAQLISQPKRKRLWGLESTISILKEKVQEEHVFPQPIPTSGRDVFLESLGSESSLFEDSFAAVSLELQLQADKGILEGSPLTHTTLTVQYKRFYPQDPYIRFWAGLSHAGESDFENAIIEYSEALRLGLDEPRVLWHLAQAALEAGATDIAREAVGQLRQRNPGFPHLEKIEEQLKGRGPLGEKQRRTAQ